VPPCRSLFLLLFSLFGLRVLDRDVSLSERAHTCLALLSNADLHPLSFSSFICPPGLTHTTSWRYTHIPQVFILLIIAASIIPLYGVIGLFAPRGARWGLRVPAEIFVLAVYFGGLYGAFQSYARALYAEIILPGEARWYGLFPITDKVCVFVRTRK